MKAAGGVSAAVLLPHRSSVAEIEGLTKEKHENEAITIRTFTEAEKLTGVPYTDNEREMMIGTIEEQILRTRLVRELNISNDYHAPATSFDPRLPDTQFPVANWRRETGSKSGRMPVNEEDIAFAPITSLSEWIRTKKLSSRDLTNIYLKRIKQFSPRLECMITVTEELASGQARQADREIAAGQYRGPLHGIPYAAKDLFDTKDIRTTWGAASHKGRIAKQDAAVIEKLNQAGAVLLGKTSLGALAFNDLWFGGLTRNPWNTEEGSGGSSAGSGSAVAAGMMPFALGSETLGSIEVPATINGVVGLRPTFGRVSRYGTMTLCWSLDKVGILSRSVEDSMLVLNTINGYDSRDNSSIDMPLAFDNTASIKGMRIAYDPKWFESATPPAVRRIPELINTLGLESVPFKLPDLPYTSLLSIMEAESAAAFDELVLKNEDDILRGQKPWARPNTLRQARFISAVDLIQTNRFRRQVMELMRELYINVDAVIGPDLTTRIQIMSIITNFTGHPALTIRAGFIESIARRGPFDDPQFYDVPSGKKRKVPVSVTLWGPLFEEGKLCRIGMEIEKALGVQHERPDLNA